MQLLLVVYEMRRFFVFPNLCINISMKQAKKVINDALTLKLEIIEQTSART